MPDLAVQQPNRGTRRQLTRVQSRNERREEKRIMKNAPDSIRFNPKKSRKVVPFNPIKNTFIEKDTAVATTPIKVSDLTEMFDAKMPENASEEKPQETKEKQEEEESPQEQEPPSQEEQEDLTKEIFDELTANQEQLATNEEQQVNDSDIKAQACIENISDPVMNQSETDAATMAAAPVDTESIDNKHTVTTTNDETHFIDTNKEHPHQQEQQQEEEPILQKETTPALSMITSASITDKISPSTSPSTSTSSNKRKTSLISRLFKHKNSSKKDVNSAQEPSFISEASSTEKKKKPKAWKIWKKL